LFLLLLLLLLLLPVWSCCVQVSMLTAMGFEVDAAEAALTATGESEKRLVHMLFQSNL
jgi:hypothetical protein